MPSALAGWRSPQIHRGTGQLGRPVFATALQGLQGLDTDSGFSLVSEDGEPVGVEPNLLPPGDGVEVVDQGSVDEGLAGG